MAAHAKNSCGGGQAPSLLFLTFSREICLCPHLSVILKGMKEKMKDKLMPICALLLCTAMWGSTFSIQKDVMLRISIFDFLGVRFVIAAGVCVILFWKQLRQANAATWRRGIILGLLFAAGQECQSYGLAHTSATSTGFLTGLYVILTPVFVFLFFKLRQPRRLWIAVTIAMIGLAIMSLNGFSLGYGDTIVLISAVIYACHVVWLERFLRGEDPLAMTAIQMIAVAVVCGLCALPSGITFPSGEHLAGDWAAIIYMALGSGVGSLLLQTWAQSRMAATKAAIIMISEPVWAALFAVILIHEVITVRVALGGTLIICAMLVSQIDLPWLRRDAERHLPEPDQPEVDAQQPEERPESDQPEAAEAEQAIPQQTA